MVVLIPAFQPDDLLLDLISRLIATRPATDVVLVDDGSGPEFEPIFTRAAGMGCDVVSYATNCGKGHALKRGFAHIALHYPGSAVVTADADGQHTVDAVFRVADRISGDETIVLGSRVFGGRRVPLRSRLGNLVTRYVFALSTGRRIGDTQTGLRGYDASLLAWLQGIDGDRFEFEMNVLLEGVEAGLLIAEVPIETVYIEANQSSHFRPLADSARIYGPLLKFSLSSLAAFSLDFVLLLVLSAVTGSLLVSVVLARLISATFNFMANRHLVFRHGTRVGLARSATGYIALASVILTANYGLMYLLTALISLPLAIAKILTETILFLASYAVQRRLVFADRVAERVPASVDG